MKIKLANGKYALIDKEDYGFLSNFSWHLSDGDVVTSIIRGTGHSVVTLEMYLFLKPQVAGKIIFHKNKNKLDNRKENLIHIRRNIVYHDRDVLKHKRKYSKYKGVGKTKSGKWYARIRVDTREKWLGQYDTEIEAAEAYNEAAREYFGEYAYQNILFPKPKH